MDPKNGGQSSSELQRQAAAQIARKKVLAAYTEFAQKSAEKEGQKQVSHLKDTPVRSQINSESWKTYHSAWQNYYQKYYSAYYANAARDYIAKERLKEAREKAEDEEVLSEAVKKAEQPSANEKEEFTNSIQSRLKQKIRKKATDNARHRRRRRRFVPLIVGIAIALFILFLQYNRLIFAPIMAYVSPGNAPANGIEALDPSLTVAVSNEPRLLIPKINVDVPIRFDVALDDVMASMNNGVTHYRIPGANAYPGEIGNFVITGHSAGDIYSANPYKFIFSGLERLEDGDLMYVDYKSVRYTYKVVKKEVIEPTNVSALVVDTDKPIMTLITCTPLGTSRYRLLVTGEQISPSYEGATEQKPEQPKQEDGENNEESLPSNEPSFFEGIWNWLTGR